MISIPDEKRLAEARDAGLVTTKAKMKPSSSASTSKQITTQTSDTSSLFENIEDSTASRTFASSPSTEKHINSFIRAFDEDDGVIEDLQPLRRISRDYKSDKRLVSTSLPSPSLLWITMSSIVISGENSTGTESVLASIPRHRRENYPSGNIILAAFCLISWKILSRNRHRSCLRVKPNLIWPRSLMNQLQVCKGHLYNFLIALF
jgi:hypothetical protein